MAEARKKILCIEDNRDTAKLFANELSERGFYALIAYDSRIGLAAIQKKIPDLVLCSVGMPDISGFEILATLNRSVPRLNRIPFVLLADRASRDDEVRGRGLGADDYVKKPVDFDILDAIIRARLVSGVVRHESSARLFRSPFDARLRASRKNGREQMVELIDAPTVDFDLDHAKLLQDRDQAEGATRGVPGQIRKP